MQVAGAALPPLSDPSALLTAEALYLLAPWLPPGARGGLRRLYASAADGHRHASSRHAGSATVRGSVY